MTKIQKNGEELIYYDIDGKKGLDAVEIDGQVFVKDQEAEKNYQAYCQREGRDVCDQVQIDPKKIAKYQLNFASENRQAVRTIRHFLAKKTRAAKRADRQQEDPKQAFFKDQTRVLWLSFQRLLDPNPQSGVNEIKITVADKKLNAYIFNAAQKDLPRPLQRAIEKRVDFLLKAGIIVVEES
ncbi:MAG: hypothetical protein KDK66_06480 [Deltaproteobacteria bacterium]|nr:hypothetical protein [Deltaproteobacteria bacterium]